MSYGLSLIVLSVTLIIIYIQFTIRGMNNWVTTALLILTIISIGLGCYLIVRTGYVTDTNILIAG
ncbi:TPA: hypothetical protein N2D99_002221 [Clostridium botulinum]|nr:hypothetical protein [Clostridium botulinum]